MIKLDDFSVTGKGGIIEIAGEPKVLRSICQVLSVIHDVLKLAEKKAEVERAKKRIKEEAARIAERAKFEKRALEVYRNYKKHFNHGCEGNHKAAVQAVRLDFKLLAVDAEGYIRKGKRLSETRRRLPLVA